jgi:Cu(I)/Ag(I) efflux system protein CusF
MPFKPLFAATLVLASVPFLSATAHAQATMDHGAMGHAAPVSAAKASAISMTEGEVKKIDAKAQTITLAHGPIKNLDMPAMTMAFKVKTPALLSKVKVGDKVKFSAEMPNGVMTVVVLELR